MKGQKTGGRKAGTPNKDNPLKAYLKTHSEEYFKPKPQVEADGSPRKITFRNKEGAVIDEITLRDADGNPLVISDFDVDVMVLDAADRVNAELRLLKFHTPEMKAIDMDLGVKEIDKTLADRLAELAGEE